MRKSALDPTVHRIVLEDREARSAAVGYRCVANLEIDTCQNTMRAISASREVHCGKQALLQSMLSIARSCKIVIRRRW